MPGSDFNKLIYNKMSNAIFSIISMIEQVLTSYKTNLYMSNGWHGEEDWEINFFHIWLI